VARFLAPLATAGSAVVRRFGADDSGEVEEVSADDPRWDELWEHLRGRSPVMVQRDRKYMSWRYGQCPTRTYRLYLGLDRGEPVGLLVTRVHEISGIRAGFVVDFMMRATPKSRAVGSALLRTAITEFRDEGIGLAAALMAPHAAEYQYLRRAGFYRCPRFLEPQPFALCVKFHDGHEPYGVPCATVSSWFVTLGDYDVI